MSATQIIEVWIGIALVGVAFHGWMLFDTLLDLGAARYAYLRGYDDIRDEHVYIARSSVAREALRVFVHILFISVGVFALTRPDWAPPELWVYLLIFSEALLVGNSILDRGARIRVKSLLMKGINGANGNQS